MHRLRRAVAATAITLSTLAVVACVPAPHSGAPSGAVAPTGAAAPAATWQDQMLASINAQRAAAGKPALARCGSLDRAAQAHTEDQAATNTMTHTGSDGSTLGPRANRAGYLGWTSLGENVAMGYSTVDAVMIGWMNSSGHRANLLNGGYTHVGVGLAHSASGQAYWTQDFGASGTC
jgi:uncharacterized protein YkwD